MAVVNLGLGEREASIDNLERALAPDSQTLPWIGQDKMFDSLRTEPRFKGLLRKIRL